MFPRTLFFALLISLVSPVIGQNLPVNQYGNELWIADSLNGVPAQRSVGFSFRPEHLIPSARRLTLPYSEGDSNTYSRIRYRFTDNQNQGIEAALIRPFSESEAITFDLARMSNPGWMVNSHSRFTSASAGLNKDIVQDKLGIDLGGSIVIFDREINGGLRSDQYRLPEDGGSFGLINNDVFLANNTNVPFNRTTNYDGHLDLSYNPAKGLKVILGGGIASTSFLYDDPSPNEVYYFDFWADTNNRILRDSNSVLDWDVHANASYAFGADSSNWKHRIDLGTSFHGIEYASYGLKNVTSNTAAYASVSSDNGHTMVFASGDFVLDGYNAGDYELAFKVKWKGKEDTATGFNHTFKLQFEIGRNRPLVVFERYGSPYLNHFNDLYSISRLDGLLSHRISYGDLSIEGTVNGQIRGNYVYLDDSLDVQQYSGNIGIAAGQLEASWSNKRWDLAGKARYQMQLSQSIYDLPEWIFSGRLGFTFPMFRKSIYVKTGVEGWYFSGYNPRGYLPFIDLYYLQTATSITGFTQLNPYFRARIQSVDVTLRLMNAAYGLLNDDPIIAPGYPSVPRYLAVSIDWTFKN